VARPTIFKKDWNIKYVGQRRRAAGETIKTLSLSKDELRSLECRIFKDLSSRHWAKLSSEFFMSLNDTIRRKT
jgi:hypothetical protein